MTYLTVMMTINDQKISDSTPRIDERVTGTRWTSAKVSRIE